MIIDEKSVKTDEATPTSWQVMYHDFQSFTRRKFTVPIVKLEPVHFTQPYRCGHCKFYQELPLREHSVGADS